MIQNEKIKSLTESILIKEDDSILKKATNSIEYHTPNHFYLDNNVILSLYEFNQDLMYVEDNNLLIKVKDEQINILYFISDNEMISLTLDSKEKNYRILYNSKEEEKSFSIDTEKMISFKKNKIISHSQIFIKKYYTKKDYELLRNLIIESIGVKQLENQIITYINSKNPSLSNVIQEEIDNINKSIIETSNKTKKKHK